MDAYSKELVNEAMKSWEDVEELIESAWTEEEILQEVESRRGLGTADAAVWLRDVCDPYVDGAPDNPTGIAAGRIVLFCDKQIAARMKSREINPLQQGDHGKLF